MQFINTFKNLHFIAYIIVYYDYVMHEILVPVSCGNSLDKLLLQLFPLYIINLFIIYYFVCIYTHIYLYIGRDEINVILSYLII